MAATLESTPQLRAMFALAQARNSRHHRDCNCRMFDRQFCNAADALWQNKLNRELDDIKASHRASDIPGELPGPLQL